MRFRRSFSRGRKSREQTIWQRSAQTLSTAASGGLAAAGIGDPTLLETASASTTDTRWTVRRIRISAQYTVTTGFTAGQNYVVFIGVEHGESGGTARDPSLTATSDTRSDWMYLGTGMLLDGATTPVAQSPDMLRHIDIKAMRKMDSQENPGLSIIVRRADTGAAPAAGVLRITAQVSVLWSRTRR